VPFGRRGDARKHRDRSLALCDPELRSAPLAHWGPCATVTGTVTFQDGTTTLATITLSKGAAKFTTSTLATGTHHITSTYNGNASFIGSSASLTQTVN
jgi:hypothetical protein